jgi:hypothetical protein
MKWPLPIMLTFLFLPKVAFCETDTFACIYKTYSDETGLHEAKKQFKLIFIIDSAKETAYMIGNQGSTDVTLFHSGEGGISFVEVTPAGNIMTTTIDSKGTSVHSRNTVFGSEIVPSQYYGECVLK